MSVAAVPSSHRDPPLLYDSTSSNSTSLAPTPLGSTINTAFHAHAHAATVLDPVDADNSTLLSKSKRAAVAKKLKNVVVSDINPISSSHSAIHTGSPANAMTRLHKRGHSVSSFHGLPSPLHTSTQLTTCAVLYDDSASPVSPPAGTPKLKPYLRKMSIGKDSSKEDQGRLDLSKPTVDNDQLSGLGIHDSAPKSATDVSFAHAARRGSLHTRTISSSSQKSTSSASHIRSAQPFVHPMRQTPRPYTPPITNSYASSLNEDEANESDDVLLDEELRIPPGFRNKRSMSLSSAALNAPTPLSQSYTPADLDVSHGLPTMPALSSRSQTNLSSRSTRSSRSSSNLRSGRPRRDTKSSLDTPTIPSSRTSIEPIVGRTKAHSDAAAREDRIRAARKKFEEKEAEKDRKLFKKQERQRRASEASEKRSAGRTSADKSPKKHQRRNEDEKHRLRALSYEQAPPPDFASLPRYGVEAGTSEKTPTPRISQPIQNHTRNAQGGWLRFSTWFSTRMMHCGTSRKPTNTRA